jgi:hypothetical protein
MYRYVHIRMPSRLHAIELRAEGGATLEVIFRLDTKVAERAQTYDDIKLAPACCGQSRCLICTCGGFTASLKSLRVVDKHPLILFKAQHASLTAIGQKVAKKILSLDAARIEKPIVQ